MDIHKPKPWRGLREFLKEYAIIVVGVLTALGAEQAVEWLHWSHQVSEARAVIAEDHRRMLGYVGTRDFASPCISRRLNELEAILDKASADGRLPPLGDIGRPPREPWTMRGWEGIVSGQALAHLSVDDATHFTAQSTTLNYLRNARDGEIDDWSVLRTLRGPGRHIGEAELASLRAALGRARNNAFRLRNTGDQLGGMVLDSHLLTSPQIAAAWRVGFDSLNHAKHSICHPIADLAAGPDEDAVLLRPPAPPSQSFDASLNPNRAR